MFSKSKKRCHFQARTLLVVMYNLFALFLAIIILFFLLLKIWPVLMLNMHKLRVYEL